MLPLQEKRQPEQEMFRRQWLAMRAERECSKAEMFHLRSRFFVSNLTRRLLKAFWLGLGRLGLHGWPLARVARIELREHTCHFADLPAAFAGYRILHLSDIHIDVRPQVADDIARRIRDVQPDLVVMTGDFRDGYTYPFEDLVPSIRHMISTVQPPDGFLAVLGNHDPAAAVPLLESLGIRVLLQESVEIVRGRDRLVLTGLDDVVAFGRPDSMKPFFSRPPGFAVALVHSPCGYRAAAAAGYRLYLTGHTHGGQVCLPGGIPLMLHTRAPRSFCNGRWNFGRLQGYTNTGAGTSGIPLRVNCPPVVGLITLQTGPDQDPFSRSG